MHTHLRCFSALVCISLTLAGCKSSTPLDSLKPESMTASDRVLHTPSSEAQTSAAIDEYYGQNPAANASDTEKGDSSEVEGSSNFQLSDSLTQDAESTEVELASASESEPSNVLAGGFASAARKTMDVLGLGDAGPLGGNQTDLAMDIARFKSFPFAFDLPSVAGEQYNSSDFNYQLWVVDVWATWCGPCRKAIPDFVELQSEFQSAGVQVVGITCDSDAPERRAETTRLAYNIGQKLGVNYPLLIDDGSTKPQIPGFRSFPTTLFVTGDGQVRYMAVGVQPKDRMAEIISTILQI